MPVDMTEWNEYRRRWMDVSNIPTPAESAMRKIDRAFTDYMRTKDDPPAPEKPVLILCKACSGSGTWGTYFEPCPTCGGDGRMVG